MKKAITVLLWILMSLIAFVFLTFPVYLAADLCDYEMDIINLPIYTALLAGFSVTVVIFGFTKIEEMVYFPDRSEVDDLNIHWENDTTLIIGTEEYRID